MTVNTHVDHKAIEFRDEKFFHEIHNNIIIMVIIS